MFTDFIYNGQATGEVAGLMSEDNGFGVRFDTGLLRPYFDRRKSDGRYVPVCNINTGRKKPRVDKDGKQIVVNGVAIQDPVTEVVECAELINNGVMSPVFNATTLTKDQWIYFDTRVQAALRERLRAWADLSAASPMGGFDAMASEMLEYEVLTDDGEALVDMDGLTEGTNDVSHYGLRALPLPITHSSFHMSRRKLAVSRKGGTPLSAMRAEQAARRVAEKIEKTLIGTVSGLQLGSAALYDSNQPKVYGYLNHPDIMTSTALTAAASATGQNMLDAFLSVRGQLSDANFNGPYMVYISQSYDDILDDDFKAESDKTTRQRLLEIDGISDIRKLDYLTGDQIIFVQMTSNVAEAINGMAPQTVQWESKAGMQLNFKVMTIQVPFIKTFDNGTTGIVKVTVS